MPAPELGPEQQREIADLAACVVDSFASGVVAATVCAVILTSEFRHRYVTTDHNGASVARRLPHGVAGMLRSLRSGMYVPRAGTWFGVTLNVSADGRHAVRFNYDDAPTESLLPEQWLDELKHFPREAVNIPQWWRDQLRKAPNVYGVIRDVAPDAVAEFLAAADWRVEPGWGGEYRASNDWASLRTLSSPQAVRLAGRVDPGRVADLEALLYEAGWDFHGELTGPDGHTGPLRAVPV